jgi:hypothetical protein
VSSIFTFGADSGSRQLRELLSALDGSSPLVIVADDLVVPQRALTPITEDPFAPTSALVAATSQGDVVVRHHRIMSVGTSYHDVDSPTHRSVGALVIAPTDAQQAREAVGELIRALDDEVFTCVGSELIEMVLVTLVRNQISVRALEIVDVAWFRAPTDVSAARSLVLAESEQRINGLLANRVDDGFYSTFVVRKLSKPLTRLSIRLGLSPNVITALSFVVGITSAALFASGQVWWIALGAVALQLSLIIDCVDGEVARATRQFTAVGAWLDAATDRVKEFAAYAGLAIGATRMDGDIWGVNVWLIAIALIVLQTTRHVSDYDFARIQRLREASVPHVDIREPSDGLGQAQGVLAGAMQTSAQLNRRSSVRWFKKVIHMPIGERWLLLSVLAVLFGPGVALVGLLVAGVVALTYVLVGRVARTLTWSTGGLAMTETGSEVLRAQLDAGPIAAAITRIFPAARPSLSGRFSWSIPVGLRGFELAAIALLATSLGSMNLTVTFGILFIIAYHHYDNLYRSLQGAAPPRWLTWAGFGWDGRILVIAMVAAVAAWEPTLLLLTGWWVLWFAVVASLQWLRSNQ